jgi:P4 family phage/plasmid primase-like protien
MSAYSSTPILEYLSTIVLGSTSKHELSPELQQVLLGYNLLLHVQYLLMDNVHSKTQLYALYSKNMIKFPTETSPTFYVWNRITCLWEENDKNVLESIYLRDTIHNIYMTMYSLIDTIPRNIPKKILLTSSNQLVPKNGKIISTIDDLCKCLLNVKNNCITKNKLREIVDKYIRHITDREFSKFLNPPDFIAVDDKKIVNLRTGEMRDRTHKDYFTREIKIRYDPSAVSELWNTVIDQITLSKQDKINFLKEFYGYCLTGNGKQGKLLMMIGSSRAGKSVILSLLDFIFGEFAVGLDNSIIVNTGKISNAPDPFLADLKNRRLGIMNELQQSDVINTRKFKVLVTNEKLAYRNLYSKEIEQTTSQHVLILASNHKPSFPETDQSIWERLIIVNFKAKFVDEPENEEEFPIDRDLFSKLQLHKEAILRWLIDGAISFYKKGKLSIPKSSLKALEHYKTISQDENEAYFDQRLERTKNKDDKIKTVDLYTDYKRWCTEYNVKRLYKTPFFEFIDKKKVPYKKSDTSYYTHIKFKEDVYG